MENELQTEIKEKEKETEKKNNKKGELIVIDNDLCSFNSKDQSLQGNFNKFKSYMKSMQKQHKGVLTVPSFRENPERMDSLRQKFIAKAKECIGIPYGKKWLIAHPDYDSDLFLDCCGLVRYVLNELKDEFSFQLCRWNQSYQFDTLPDPIPFDQLKPGDVVFYSGTNYPDRNRKKQVHDMAHVEIFLGGEDRPERTIGSRDSTGTVEIFDTFQFQSENYYNIRYYFKSIDTWLKGIHRSFCKEHKWHEEYISYDKVTKYSCFYNAEQSQDQNQTQTQIQSQNKSMKQIKLKSQQGLQQSQTRLQSDQQKNRSNLNQN